MEYIDVVRGRARLRIAAEELRERAQGASTVHIDVGTGDGRQIYRLDRRDPAALFIGVDANAEALQRVSYRASRKPARGGLANAVFVRAALNELPGGLAGLADRVTVCYPWGSLLRALVEPDARALAALAGLGRPGASFEARINRSAADPDALDLDALAAAYRLAGIDASWEVVTADDRSTWAARVRPHDGRVLRLFGRIAPGYERGAICWSAQPLPSGSLKKTNDPHG
jgi:16S rRNA (adenine(1408)-N(1))-methyltransferase